jgi:hypothetical protein
VCATAGLWSGVGQLLREHGEVEIANAATTPEKFQSVPITARRGG